MSDSLEPQRPSATSEPLAQQASSDVGPRPWERELLERMLLASIAEQRAKRRWKIFFRFFWLGLLGLVIWASTQWWPATGPDEAAQDITAVVRIEGSISADGPNNARRILEAVRLALEEPSVRGVILHINSPGGSPVQSGILHAELMHWRTQWPDKPIHAVIEEVGASGAYYIATAARNIYVQPASLVGSIGVMLDGVGLDRLMDRLGVERRSIVSGADKSFLDPFSPVNPEQQARAERMVMSIHEEFIRAVRLGRADRLVEGREPLFTGRVWTGAQSRELGLVDDFGTVESVARDVIGAPELVDFTLEDSVGVRLARRFGAALGLPGAQSELPVWR